MDLFELAKEINKKRKGNVQDFIDFLIIIRKWLDKNYALHQHLNTFTLTEHNINNDIRFVKLRNSIMQKKLHAKTKKENKTIYEKKKDYDIFSEILNRQKDLNKEYFYNKKGETNDRTNS